MNILDKIITQYHHKLPFVVYNKPNSQNLIGLFQKNNDLYETSSFEEIGFVFAPFVGESAILIPEKNSELLVEAINFENIIIPNKIIFEVDEILKTKHINLVKKGIEKIKSGELKKVVLSRVETFKISDFDLILTFKNIVNQFPNAFSYCFYHPEIGLWMGAFSEQLLKINGINFSTASLAGTQKVTGVEPIIWQEKEILEQKIVTDDIKIKLENQVAELLIAEPKTIYSGNLAHIKSEISGKLNQFSNLKSLLKILHPTPAICGFPTKLAKEFILNNEDYNRSYYSGFLGELNKDFQNNLVQSDLFVNLRCLKIQNNQVSFFAGGGITIDSEPEKEYEETVNKIFAMKNCFA